MIIITDKSINNVPRTKSDIISEQYWEHLYIEHIALLKLVQDKQLGTECARVFDLNMKKIGSDFIGEPGENRVVVTNFDTPHVIIHNHADGSTISLVDVNSFLRRPQTFSIHAVSNGGSVYTLEKLYNYNAVEAIRKYICTIDRVTEQLNDRGEQALIERIIEDFLVSLNANGFLYRRWEK